MNGTPMEQMDVLDEDVGEEKKQTKRKNQIIFDILPESASIGCSPEVTEELQKCYEILQTILSVPKIDAFLVKPNGSLFGMSMYYEIIKTPMWLDEVHRKLLEGEYRDISKFVADIRLMLENCYRFWGAAHKFTKKGLQIEHKLELMISELPPVMREKCIDHESLYSEIEIKNEIVEETTIEGAPPVEVDVDEIFSKGSIVNEQGYFESKILNRVMDNEEELLPKLETTEEEKEKKAMMLAWETENLVTPELRQEISSMWQLADIGYFLKLTYEVLNIEEMAQYEVERMLLMPKESKTLATLMTSLLSPATMRANLDVTPVMPYAVWTQRLKRKVTDWFNTYYKRIEVSEIQRLLGIDPHFFIAMAQLNPLAEKQFHEITFLQRAWILKSLCDFILHTNKCVLEVFMNESNLSELRPTHFGCDKEGYSYYSLPFLPETRVYKQAAPSDSPFDQSNLDDINLEFFYTSTQFKWNETENEMEVTPDPEDFYLFADSAEDLSIAIEDFKYEEPRLYKTMSKFLREAKKHHPTFEGLLRLHNQWKEYQEKPEGDDDLALWFAHGPKNLVEEKSVLNEPEVLGKRKTRLNTMFSHCDPDSGSDIYGLHESDVSDWESTHTKKKKRRKKKKASGKTTSNAAQTDESLDAWSRDGCDTPASRTCSEPQIDRRSVSPFSVTDTKPPPEMVFTQVNKTPLIKTEIDIKPEKDDLDRIMGFTVKCKTEEDAKPIASNNDTVSQLLVPFRSDRCQERPVPKVKVETEESIVISSDDEIEIKPVLRLTNIDSLLSKPPSQPQAPPVRKAFQPQPTSKPPPQMSPMRTSQQQVRPLQNQLTPIKSFSPSVRGMSSPRGGSPRGVSPRGGRLQYSPVLKSAQTPPQRGISPRQISPRTPPRARTQLFTNPRGAPLQRSPGQRQIRPSGFGGSPRGGMNQQPVRPASNLPIPKPPQLEGTLHVGQKPDGSYGYHIRLPDGGIIDLSREEVNEIRKKHNGAIPPKIQVPTKSFF